ncbi:MAG: prepilin-type N-terminal cleavage/methylation domain-containing protein [Burkholderiales bacterium]|nr:prepilin-type N-terminal cleavage/methylation domain-containing protein [Burkholderiales bacterium]
MIARAAMKGFTLLEAVVALAIFSMVAMALMSWMNASTETAMRLDRRAALDAAKQNVIEYMQSVNPAARPTGEEDFGSYVIEWKASRTTDEIDQHNFPTGSGLYVVALFRVDIKAKSSTDPDWFRLSMKMIGYRRVREAFNPLAEK